MVTNKQIKYVFVVMLENHSFDAMLTQYNPISPVPAEGYSNKYNHVTYPQMSPAPLSMTTDPGHELDDTLEQLTNISKINAPLGPYPRGKFPLDFPNGTWFVKNYVTNADENNPAPPAKNRWGHIMKCFSAQQLPILNQLANEFAVCTNWFSSLPGPTWPNRFFLHFASSNGMDCSPTQNQLEEWAIPGDGFTTNNGSIFQALSNAGLNYRIYNDCDKFGFSSCFSDDPDNGGGDDGMGWIPQAASLSGINYDSWYELQYYLKDHLANDYACQYTFIEPHYGNITNNTYEGGSSQHPMDDVYGGEALLKFVYETIRNSPIWYNSLLIVTYDEHGGFYDSVPPPSGIPPGDGSPGYGQKGTLNLFGFEFDQLGIRVPALLISPWVAAGTIDTTNYDHTSVLATLSYLFGTPSNPLQLTNRDKNANNVFGSFTLSKPRTDCPVSLNGTMSSQYNKEPRLTPEQIADIDQQPVPVSGNLVGSMGVLLKMHLEMASGDDVTQSLIKQQFDEIKTKGQLKTYAREVAALFREKRMSK